MWLALNVGRDVAADVCSRGAVQISQITAKIIYSGRGPPERKRVRVLAELFPRVQIVSFKQGFGAFKLVVAEIVFVIEMRHLVIDGANCGARLIGTGLRADLNGADVTLRQVANRDSIDQTRVNQIALKTRIGLSQDERENVRSISGRIVLANGRTVPADVNKYILHHLIDR